MTYRSGRHFLQLPGPSPVPDRVLRAISQQVIDHRGPDFQALTRELLSGLRALFGAQHPVLVFPSSATGAWEAAIANTLSPGDSVLAFDQGFFARKWARVAERFGLDVRLAPWESRRGLAPDAIIDTLRRDTAGRIKAVLVVHNETSTGVTSDLELIATVMRESGHPAMLFVDAVSSLAVSPLKHDDWHIDVTVSGSQKGLMLPPGLSFVAISLRALEAHRSATIARGYWDWSEQIAFNADGFFPYTPATNLLYGLQESLAMIREEGLDNIFLRHESLAEATRTAVTAWDLETYAANPAEASNAVTAVMMPERVDADAVRGRILEEYDMSLGTGLGALKGRVFRIGHLGHINELTLLGALAGVEMGLRLARVPYQPGGVQAAIDFLTTGGETDQW